MFRLPIRYLAAGALLCLLIGIFLFFLIMVARLRTPTRLTITQYGVGVSVDRVACTKPYGEGEGRWCKMIDPPFEMAFIYPNRKIYELYVHIPPQEILIGDLVVMWGTPTHYAKTNTKLDRYAWEHRRVIVDVPGMGIYGRAITVIYDRDLPPSYYKAWRGFIRK